MIYIQWSVVDRQEYSVQNKLQKLEDAQGDAGETGLTVLRDDLTERSVQKWIRSVTVESFEKVKKNGTITQLGGLEELTGLTRTGTSTGKLTETGNLFFSCLCSYVCCSPHSLFGTRT